jgi:PAS domain S-box-containing protein
MSWITVVWSMSISACLTMALIHLAVWARDRTARAHLAYSFMSVAAVGIAICELALMRAETASQAAAAIRWIHVPIFVLVIAVVAFVRLHLGTGRPWLGLAIIALRLVSLILNFLLEPNLNYRVITGVTRLPLFGEMISVPEGVASPWLLVAQASGWLLVLFTVDASVQVWREGSREQRRRAAFAGGGLALFLLLGFGRAALVNAGVDVPLIVSLPFLAIVAAMGYELSLNMLRTVQLTRQLQDSEAALRASEERMTLAADAARVGMWIGDLAGKHIWVTDKCRELFGLQSKGEVTYEDFVQRIHPEDRAARARAIEQAAKTGSAYTAEYRVLLPDGAVRWIVSRGRVEGSDSSQPIRMLGVCLDVSERREAESAARELSGRLIHAQEDERRRIARDLHDDLTQRLAILSVELELLGRVEPGGDAGAEARRMAGQLREVSADVHKLAYQLHPAKLDQLGLVTTARSWCRDLSQQSGLTIDFSAEHVPPDLSPDVSLCLYRIIQESLHNVVRHSHSTAARVELVGEGDDLRLTVTDEGQGFDVHEARRTGGLGLLSMQERMRLLHGTMAVYSTPGHGASVEASVPLLRSHVTAR